MKNRLILSICVLFLAITSAFGQGYVPTPVTISKETVKVDGKLYYSHVVLERQTLYSISKTYMVSIEEIYEANEAIKLRETGLKKNSIIRIPVNSKNKAKKGKTVADGLEEENPEVVTPEVEEPDTVATATTAPISITKPVEIQDSTMCSDTLAAADTITTEKNTDALFSQNHVSLAMLLPFNLASGKGDPHYFDFYSGALIAAAEVGKTGIGISLDVYDCTSQLDQVDSAKLCTYDIILGPVSKEDMETVLGRANENVRIVSPMDPRTEELVSNHKNLIQVHVPKIEQMMDIVRRVSEKKESDKLLIISEAGVDNGVDSLKTILNEASISYDALSVDIAHSGAFTQYLVPKTKGTCHVVLISDRKLFINDVLRTCSRLNEYGAYDIRTYSTSKLKILEVDDVQYLHGAALSVSSTYNVDYTTEKVRSFLLRYRALFHTEPSSFAYQGYDLTKYFVNIIAEYGTEWYKYLPLYERKMLQINIKFRQVENGGYMNTGVRRIIYNKSLDIESAE